MIMICKVFKLIVYNLYIIQNISNFSEFLKLEEELVNLGIPLCILKKWKTYIGKKSTLVETIFSTLMEKKFGYKLIMKLHQYDSYEEEEDHFFVRFPYL